jgi:hypothetical protein
MTHQPASMQAMPDTKSRRRFGAELPSSEWQWMAMLAYRDASTTPQKISEILHSLVAGFSDYVGWIARRRWKQFRYIGRTHGLEDIILAGRHGLILAITKWQPWHGKPLSHYASKWITYGCLHEALSMAYGGAVLPHHSQKILATYLHVCEANGRAEAERFLRSTRTRERTRALVREQCSWSGPRMVSLDRRQQGSYTRHKELSLLDTIPDEAGGIGTIEALNLVDTFRSFLLVQCSQRERLIVARLHPNTVLGYGPEVGRLGMPSGGPLKPSFGLLAAELGVSRERVRQIYEGIKGRFRTHLSERSEEWRR